MEQEKLDEEQISFLERSPFVRCLPDGSYTFHSLLLEFLRKQFSRESIESQRKMLIKAGQAYALERKNANAARCFIKVEEWEEFLALPFTNIQVMELCIEKKGENIKFMLEKCPPEIYVRHPITILKFALELFTIGAYDEYGQLVEILIEMSEQGRISAAQRKEITGYLEFLQAFMSFNDVAEMDRHFRATWELLGHSVELYPQTETWTFGTPSVVSLYWSEKGNLKRMVAQMYEAMPYYYRLANGHGYGSEVMADAEARFLAGRMEEAEVLCYKAIYQAEKKGQDCICFCAELLLARIAVFRGDTEGFTTAFGAISERGENSEQRSGPLDVEVCQGYLYSMLGMYERISEWMLDAEMIRECCYTMTVPFVSIPLARKNAEQAVPVFLGQAGDLMEDAAKKNLLLPQIYYLVFEASALEKSGNMQGAAGKLREVLSYAASDEVYMPAAEMYGPLKRIFDSMVLSKEERMVFAHIRELGEKQAAGVKKVCAVLSPGRVELTNREYEIAVLIKSGFTAKEAAVKLGISEHTVRNILRNVYQKLDINKKTELRSKLY